MRKKTLARVEDVTTSPGHPPTRATLFRWYGHPLSLANFAPYNTTARLAGSDARKLLSALPKRGILFRLQLFERVGVLLVEVYERVGKSSLRSKRFRAV